MICLVRAGTDDAALDRDANLELWSGIDPPSFEKASCSMSIAIDSPCCLDGCAAVGRSVGEDRCVGGENMTGGLLIPF